MTAAVLAILGAVMLFDGGGVIRAKDKGLTAAWCVCLAAAGFYALSYALGLRLPNPVGALFVFFHDVLKLRWQPVL